MIKVIGNLKDILKREEIIIDGPVFRFHNVFTAVLLFACSVIITATQYVGTPIQCIVDSLPPKPVNTFCWIMSTFTMPAAYGKRVGIDVPHPGIANEYAFYRGHNMNGGGDDDDDDGSSSVVSSSSGETGPIKKYYTYYQWVCFALFFQGLACYLPKLLWDNCEGGLMKTLVSGLNQYLYTESEKKKKKRVVVDYVLQHLKRHRLYAIRYWCCELLCVFNVFAQLYFMNRFFDGEFYDYGLRVIQLSDQIQEKRVDPMIYIFPRVTKCTFRKYGASGTIQEHDSLCILPLNIVNEKTYILIWFWFVALAAILSLLVVYRVFLCVCPSLRPRLLRISRKIASRRDAVVVTNHLDVGDWWLLYMLGKNLDPAIYNEIVVDLAKRMEDPNGALRRSR